MVVPMNYVLVSPGLLQTGTLPIAAQHSTARHSTDTLMPMLTSDKRAPAHANAHASARNGAHRRTLMPMLQSETGVARERNETPFHEHNAHASVHFCDGTAAAIWR